MMNFFKLAALGAFAGTAVAQTATSCNPLHKTCPPDPALGTQHTWDFSQTLDPNIWDMKTGPIAYSSQGADFTLTAPHQSTLLVSKFYIFFGVVESWVKSAKGKGMVSSVILQSDDLDEIDWEWVGANTSQVQTNFYGKGNTTTWNRGANFYVPNADTEWHNYTTYWDQNYMQWWIDGVMVRQLDYGDPLALWGKNYPQTPSQVKISIWPAGQPGTADGTVDWAGGMVDYSQAPFTMSVKSVRVQDFHSGKSYSYSDNSGSWQSINVTPGNSSALQELSQKTLAQKWAALPEGAHIGVYVGAAAAGVLIFVALGLCCLRQRRKGRLEHALDDARFNNERTEMMNYQSDWKQSEWKHGGYSQVHG